MKLFEDDQADYDAAEDARLSQVYDRERKVEQVAAQICQKVGLTALEGHRPIMFSEDEMLCTIKVNEEVTLTQLEAFKAIADDITISGHYDFGVIVTLKVRQA